MKGRSDTALMTGWHGANLTGARKMPDLHELLHPPTKAEKRQALVDMFKRIKERGDEVRSDGLQGA